MKENLTLTDQQIVVDRFSPGNLDARDVKSLTPNYTTASDDTDGSDSDSDTADSGGEKAS